MVTVHARQNEPVDNLLKRFRTRVTKSGILAQVRSKRWHMSKSEARRLARKKAIRRLLRKERKRQERSAGSRY